MSTQTNLRTEPAGSGYTSPEVFQAIERSRGRLRAVVYACFGLRNAPGKEAACLVWILDDVVNDLDRLAAGLDKELPKER